MALLLVVRRYVTANSFVCFFSGYSSAAGPAPEVGEAFILTTASSKMRVVWVLHST
jgi:hypothetical protein